MNRTALNRLHQLGYGRDDAENVYIVTPHQPTGLNKVVPLTAGMITTLQNGVTEEQWNTAIEAGKLYHSATELIRQLVANSIEPLEGAVFTFENGDTVPITQNGVDISARSATDQANYRVMRDILTLAL